MRRTPYMNGALILLNLILFAFQLVFRSRGVNLDGTVPLGGFDLTAFGRLHPLDIHFWNFLTYGFLHSPRDLWHVAGNMIFLYIFGNAVNAKLGHGAYLGFYLGGAAFAGLCHVLGDFSPVIGASGAVWAVTGAYIVLFPRARVTVLYFFFFIGAIELPGLWLVGVYLLFDVLGQIGVSALGSSGNVAHLAHLGGAFYGLVVGLLLLWLKLLPRDDFDMLALVSRWNRRRQFRDLTRKGFDPFESSAADAMRPQRSKKSVPAPLMDRIHDLRATVSDALGRGDADAAAEAYRQLVAIDDQQVLSARHQLEVAGKFYQDGAYADAAAAWERYLAVYPRHEHVDQTRLMLGLVYRRYLHRPQDAKRHLGEVVDRLADPEDVALARDELQAAEAAATPTSS